MDGEYEFIFIQRPPTEWKTQLRIHRIHTDDALEPDTEISLQGTAAHYLLRVLRVAPGQGVVLFNGDGSDYAAELISAAKKDVLIRILSRLPARAESPFPITLVQALNRGERMDQTLQKSTELGATAFQPVNTERVEVRIKSERLGKRMEHWRNVVISGCEQCGRAIVPPVFEPLELADWLGHASGAARIVLQPGAETALARIELKDKVELLIGPEGGFSDSELALMRLHGAQVASLGPRILRTETAGPAAIAILQSRAGDLK
jgi:16S rRNA (uracil1498-N3)-methyltransferase